MDSYKNKTLLTQSRERNEKNCSQSRRIVIVPIVIKPVVVPAPPVVIEIQITNIQVAVRVAVAYRASPVSPPLECS